MPYGLDSDQLIITLTHNNSKIAEDYINSLIAEFDSDGVRDRQLEYKRTIDFVTDESEILSSELEKIELRKQEFKVANNISDAVENAKINLEQSIFFSNELFNEKSQKDLSLILIETLKENEYNLLPLNIGIENSDVNNLINLYNNKIRQREQFLITAGPKNVLVLKSENELNEILQNIENTK